MFNVSAVVGVRWIAAAAHSGPGSVALWVIASVLFFIPSVLAVSRLGAHYPEEGGVYVWANRVFGSWHGFLCGWTYWLSWLFFLPNLIIAGVSIAAVGLGANAHRDIVLWISIAILWLLLLVSVTGTSGGKWIGNLGGVATLATGIALAALAFDRGQFPTLNVVPEWNLPKLNFWSQIAMALTGLELGATMGGEIRNPARTIPLAAALSAFAIGGAYIAGTWSLLALLPPERISPMTGLVDGGGAFVGIAALAAIIGQLGSCMNAAARLPFAIGADAYLPRAFARVHPRFRTPHVALLSQGAIATILVLVLQAGESLRSVYQILVDLSVVATMIPFLYLFAASWRCGLRWSAASGLAVTTLATGLALVPPPDVFSIWTFELKVAGGTVLVIAIARWLYLRAVRRSGARPAPAAL